MLYKHIIVAVDGSKISLLALKHAAKIIKLTKSELTLINVINPTEYMALSPEFIQHETYEAAAMEQSVDVLNQAEKIAKANGVRKINRHIAISTKGIKDMAQQVVDYAVKNGGDLIVLGTNGRTGLMNLVMGSFAETIMKQSTLPLLILCAGAEVD